MRKARLLVVCVMALVGVGGLADGLAGQDSSLEQLRWMAGCWERTTGERWLEEQWMRPRGDMMLGMSRTVRGDRVVEHEALRIEEREGRLVYVAHPSGQAVAEFESTEVTDTSAVFENWEHDFPQRILYRRSVRDSLFVRIEGRRGEEMRGIDFRMARARCAQRGVPADAAEATREEILGLGPGSREIFEERMVDAKVLTHGNLAQVWARYEARFGDPGEIAEWRGIDAFTLMRHDGEWRIVALSYTDEGSG